MPRHDGRGTPAGPGIVEASASPSGESRTLHFDTVTGSSLSRVRLKISLKFEIRLPSAAVRLSVPCARHEELEAPLGRATAMSADPIRCRHGFGHGKSGAGLRRPKAWCALRCPLPSRRRSQESSAALYYVGYVWGIVRVNGAMALELD
jgi:hypothetical protein